MFTPHKTERISLFPDRPNITLTTYVAGTHPSLPFNDKRKAILILPGGGYTACAGIESEPIAHHFLASGFNAFVLEYTTLATGNPLWPTPLIDASAAMKYIRDNAEQFGVDPERIAALGFSAGGHLCSAIGAMGENKPNALILAYPCILSEIGQVLQCDVPSTNEYVTDKTPPTFIFAAVDDKLVPVKHSLAFASACAENGVDFEMHLYEQGGHGFSLATPNVCMGGLNADACKWGELSINWLRKHF